MRIIKIDKQYSLSQKEKWYLIISLSLSLYLSRLKAREREKEEKKEGKEFGRFW